MRVVRGRKTLTAFQCTILCNNHIIYVSKYPDIHLCSCSCLSVIPKRNLKPLGMGLQRSAISFDIHEAFATTFLAHLAGPQPMNNSTFTRCFTQQHLPTSGETSSSSDLAQQSEYALLGMRHTTDGSCALEICVRANHLGAASC